MDKVTIDKKELEELISSNEEVIRMAEANIKKLKMILLFGSADEKRDKILNRAERIREQAEELKKKYRT